MIHFNLDLKLEKNFINIEILTKNISYRTLKIWLAV